MSKDLGGREPSGLKAAEKSLAALAATERLAQVREKLRRRTVELAVLKAPEGGPSFVLAGGGRSDWYVDMRQVLTDPEGVMAVAHIAAIEARDFAAAVVGGPSIAGAVMGTAAMLYRATADPRGGPLRSFVYRTEVKGRGTGNNVEGKISPGDRVLLVEDVVTTGGSALRAADAVEKLGGKVVRALVLLDRSTGDYAVNRFADRGIPLASVFRPKDLGIEEAAGG